MSGGVIAAIVVGAVFVVVVVLSVRIAREYERVAVFRLGRLIGARGPGLVLVSVALGACGASARLPRLTPGDPPPPADCIANWNQHREVGMAILSLFGPPRTARLGARLYRSPRYGCVATFTDDKGRKAMAFFEEAGGWETVLEALHYAHDAAKSMYALQYTPHNAQLGDDYRLRPFRG